MNEEKWQEFLDWMDANGWSQGRLADECVSSRAHLNQVLRGSRPGNLTWKRVVRTLPVEAVLLLQQGSSWNRFAEAAFAQRREREKLIEIGKRVRESEVQA